MNFVARRSYDWFADSGATKHMTDQLIFLHSFENVEPGKWLVSEIVGTKLSVFGQGDVYITSFVTGEILHGTI